MNFKRYEQYQDYLARITNHLQYSKNLKRKNPLNDVCVKTVTFQVTDRCNLACTYCYQINKHHNTMPFEIAKKFIDLLFDEYEREGSYIYKAKGLVIEFIGGEPLLEIDLIDKITDYFLYKAIILHHEWATNSMFSMISNGILYFDERVQNYLKKNKGKISFGISLDGCKELHDACRVFPDGKPTYDIAEKGCLHYKKYFDSNMYTKMTIAPSNVTYVFEAIKNLIENLNYEIIHCNCIYEEGWELSHAKELYKQLKLVADYILDNNLEEDIYISIFEEYNCSPLDMKDDNRNYCGSTGCMLACDPFGKIYPCIRFMDTSLGNEVQPFSIGDVDNGIGILPKHKDKINILDSITLTSQSTNKCIECPIARGCGWCSGYNYQKYKTINKRATFICVMHQARALAHTYYWNKVYRKEKNPQRAKLYTPKEWALNIISEDEYDMLKNISKED